MRKMINSLTGGEMWVADNRVEEYLAAGHKLAAVPQDEPIAEPEEAPEEAKAEPVAKKTAGTAKKRKR